MGITDILRFLLVSIKVGYASKQKYTYTRYNNFLLELLNVLYKQQFIEGYTVDILNRKVKITLKYINNKPIISNIDLLTSSSFKNYLNYSNLKKMFHKYDYLYVFTSTGLIVFQNINYSRLSKVGGQALFGLKILVE